ncbi:MAG: helix-turn-helix domain-containing protein, partial [bacterium]
MNSIGEQFKKRRTHLGISLHRVHVDTHISNTYLNALEEDAFDVFPAEVYLRGFIKKYALYLGLNSDELLAQHQ